MDEMFFELLYITVILYLKNLFLKKWPIKTGCLDKVLFEMLFEIITVIFFYNVMYVK